MYLTSILLKCDARTENGAQPSITSTKRTLRFLLIVPFKPKIFMFILQEVAYEINIRINKGLFLRLPLGTFRAGISLPETGAYCDYIKILQRDIPSYRAKDKGKNCLEALLEMSRLQGRLVDFLSRLYSRGDRKAATIFGFHFRAKIPQKK